MKIKGKNGISLIVLVITVIILSILATTVIISLSNTNIISKASDAVKKTEEQQIKEAKSLMYTDGILGGTPEDVIIGDTTLRWDASTQSVLEIKSGDDAEGPDDNDDTVLIPFGFYYVGGEKDTGFVISDNYNDENKGVNYLCTGNQFVWVPVDNYSEFVRGTARKNDDEIYKMIGDLDEYYEEYYSEEYYSSLTSNSWEETEYNNMCASVEKYGGFYIARFEAGDGQVSSARTGETDAHVVVSKKGAVVYDYVAWCDTTTSDGGSEIDTIAVTGSSTNAGAASLARNMYYLSSVTSTLCYGVQWDAVMNFVSDSGHDITSSASWGNATNDNAELTTGANNSWQAKNIYDLAGNVSEWTMEYVSSHWDQATHLMVGPGRVVRGGNVLGNGNCDASSRTMYGEGEAVQYRGFRVALYLN